MKNLRKKIFNGFVVLLMTGILANLSAQDKKDKKPDEKPTTTPETPKPAAKPEAPKSGPKPYKEVITDKAKTSKGLVTIHKIEEKYYFEIPDSLLNREIMAVTRFSKTPAGGGIYGGEEVNEQVISWEKAPDNKVFYAPLLW